MNSIISHSFYQYCQDFCCIYGGDAVSASADLRLPETVLEAAAAGAAVHTGVVGTEPASLYPRFDIHIEL